MKDTGIVNIHGKEYQTVAYRVSKFRELHPNWSLTTDVLFRDFDVVVMKATILDDTGRVLATGHAEEFRADGKINKTSALENAETSAIGRALATLGLGGTEFATADEVTRALTGKPNAPISPTREAWNMIQPEQQQFLRSVAQQIVKAMPDTKQAHQIIFAADLDQDHKAALWHLLDAPTRKALKESANV